MVTRPVIANSAPTIVLNWRSVVAVTNGWKLGGVANHMTDTCTPARMAQPGRAGAAGASVATTKMVTSTKPMRAANGLRPRTVIKMRSVPSVTSVSRRQKINKPPRIAAILCYSASRERTMSSGRPARCKSAEATLP